MLKLHCQCTNYRH